MSAAPKLATLAEAADMKRWAGATLGMNADDSIAERVIALCATVERLVTALKDITDAGGTADEIEAARALLTQLGATP